MQEKIPDEMYSNIREKLNELSKECVICKENTNRILLHELAKVELGNDTVSVRLPIVVVICKQCAHVDFYSYGMLKEICGGQMKEI